MDLITIPGRNFIDAIDWLQENDKVSPNKWDLSVNDFSSATPSLASEKIWIFSIDDKFLAIEFKLLFG